MRGKPTVYIETTVPSYYFETRTSQGARAWRSETRAWWRQDSSRFHLVTSSVTLFELARAPQPKRLSATRLMVGVELLPEVEQIRELRSAYIESLSMPDEAAGDADHLAFASAYRVDFLLTWNCRHLANANKFRQLGVVNARFGLPLPIIVTPLQLRQP